LGLGLGLGLGLERERRRAPSLRAASLTWKRWMRAPTYCHITSALVANHALKPPPHGFCCAIGTS
jgi:hypothetical protein